MKICMLLMNKYELLLTDSRVLKEAKSLTEAGHEVVIALYDERYTEGYVDAFGAPIRCVGLGKETGGGRGGKKHGHWTYSLIKLLPDRVADFFFGMVERALLFRINKRFLEVAISEEPDVYHVHDYVALLSGWIAAKTIGVPAIYDSHECYVYVQMSPKKRRLVTLMEGVMARQYARIITVNETCANTIKRVHGVKKPVIISNYAMYIPQTKTDVLRKKYGIPEDKKIVLYVGALQEGRGLYTVLDAAPRIEECVFVLMGPGPLRKELAGAVKKRGLKNVIIADPVPPTQLLEHIASADVGLCLIENISKSYYYSLPNKIGEYIMGGIPIVVSDFPEMKKPVVKYNIGITCDPEDPEELVSVLKELLRPEVYSEKIKHMADAQREFNWENEAKKLVDLYNSLSS